MPIDFEALWREALDEAAITWREARQIQPLLLGLAVGLACLLVAWLLLGKRSTLTTEPIQRRGRSLGWSALLAFIGAACLVLSSYQIGSQRSRGSAVRNLRPVCTPSQAFERLKTGQPVRRAIRLIAYDPAKEPELAVARLTMLGVPHEKFIFVADYDELAGCTAAQALYKIGREVPKTSRVSAVIYPIGDRTIFSANARGVLKAVLTVDRQQGTKGDPGAYRRADLSKILSKQDLAGLQEPISTAWAWKSFGPMLDAYTKAVRQLQAEKCSAFDFIGLIDRDWNSLGYAQVIADVHMQPDDFTLSVDGRAIPVKDFGGRVFLTENAKIADLEDACLLQFADPFVERIPELGPPPSIGDLKR